MKQPSRSAHALWCFLWLFGLVGLALVLRWPALQNPGFHNEDVAGITYNADLLMNQFIPLVDNLEYKAPGAFFLSAFAWLSLGRSIVTLQWIVFLLSLLAAFGVHRLVTLLYDRRRGEIAAALYVVLAPITDSMDANYGAWMIAPYIWSSVCFVLALRRRQFRYFLMAGALLAIAGLIKRQAAVLVGVYLLTGLAIPRTRVPDGWMTIEHRGRAAMALLVGLVIGFAPIFLWYLSRGQLWSFCEQYFFSSSGWSYLKGELSFSERLLRLGDGFQGLWAYVATPTLLASFAIMYRVRQPQHLTIRSVFVASFLAMSFIGAALGLRFFKSYYLQVLPALLVLSVHPAGIFRGKRVPVEGEALQRPWGVRILILLGATFVLAPAVVQDGNELWKIRKMRAQARDGESRKIGAYIAARTQPNDRIWVWGRWGWPVYFHADRRAASHFPKTLGVFTTTLTNTWRRPTKNTAFDPQSPWPKLMKQLRARPPAFVVISKNEDMARFEALKRFLRSDYRRVSTLKVRAFSVYRHRSNRSKR
ncbi:MAG: glycosyltransferase family 39 protein [Myxococcota bacterium]|nr:glycosyltransferase family 39 protein [Myxococcota bacterium]